MTFRLALAQVSASEEKRENVKKGVELLGEAAEKGAELLVLPELFMAYAPLETLPLRMVEVAEEVDGDFVRTLAREARRRRIHLVVGILEKSGKKDRVYNTVVMVGPNGRVISTHRKLQLFDSFGYKESSRFEPASEMEGMFRTRLARVGMMTCYELRFPEMSRILALQGAQILIVPTAWVAGRMKEDHLHVLARARALENTVYVAVASQTGHSFSGRSVVVDPFGVPILDAGEEECLVTAEIDLDRLRRVREKLPSLRHIRSDVYSRHASGTLRRRGSVAGLVGLTHWKDAGRRDNGNGGSGHTARGIQTLEFYSSLLGRLSDSACVGVIAHELAHAWLNEHVLPEGSMARELSADALTREWGSMRSSTHSNQKQNRIRSPSQSEPHSNHKGQWAIEQNSSYWLSSGFFWL